MTTSTPPCEMVAFKDHITVILRPAIVQSSWSEIESFGADVRAELERRNPPACVVDLSPLTYMGSSIVALIVRVWKVVQARGGKMVVVCTHPGVREVIELAGLDKIWTMAPELAAAQKKLGVKASFQPMAPGVAGSPESISRTETDNSSAPPSWRIWYFALGAISVLAAVIAVLVIVSKQ